MTEIPENHNQNDREAPREPEAAQPSSASPVPPAPQQPSVAPAAPQPSVAQQPTTPQPAPPTVAHQPTTPQPVAPQPTFAQPTAAYPSYPATSASAPLPPHPGVRPPASESDAVEKPKRSAPLGVVAALAIGALVGGVSGAGVSYWAFERNGGDSSGAKTVPATISVNDPDNATAVTAVAASAGASVVTISAVGQDGGGTGSGVIISTDGHILTNTHVVTLSGATDAAEVRVQMSDGRLFPAEIIGTDPQSDLAVIKIDKVPGLTAIEFADSSDLNVGDSAIAIGAPLGLNNTVTNGIISALNRSITIASSAVPEESSEPAPDRDPSPFDMWQFDVPGEEQPQNRSSTTISLSVIQTDAAINPGNSGGALLNGAGELIGVNVAIASAGEAASGNIGVGFAVPSNLAKRVSDEIIATGKATHGLLGASIVDVTEDEKQIDSATVGASIIEIVDGAAKDAGLQVGDVITGINGLPITGKTDLTAQVRALAAGASAEVTFVRDGGTKNVTVILGELTQ